ncbi:alpha/beta fold hydrolase [Glycomyces rhizosphaerae]|uniref:Alpha/beta fold hydrolase n=1 Tax=Glycomyces rhizosphaerae TaxID=2054422 RepID=A0ABV7Q092_9ACTN
MPALRFDHLLHHSDRERDGERWGADGRPVLLLNDPGCDRSAWWPVAARLADEHAVAVLDLPEGHSIGDQAEILAEYVARMGTRAPVVAGHGAAALVASLFAARYVAHAVVTIEQRLDESQPEPEAERALQEIIAGPRRLKCRYLSIFASAPQTGYETWLEERIPGAICTAYRTEGNFPHLSDPKRFTDDIREIAT